MQDTDVVRCRDCLFASGSICLGGNRDPIHEDFFCANGKRKYQGMYPKLVNALHLCAKCGSAADALANAEAAAVAIEKLAKELKDCANELCLKCEDYNERHLGACDGCRWFITV